MQTQLFQTPAEWRTRLQGSEFRVMRLHDAPMDNTLVDQPAVCATYLQQAIGQSIIFRPDVENLIVLSLDTRKHCIGWEIISQGTVDCVFAHPREIFKSAIIANAAGFILAHNHPSGDPSPSGADAQFTRELVRAGELMKIPVVDHIILGRKTATSKGWLSLRENGYLY